MKKYKAAIWQFIQFNIVGILNTAVDFLVFTLLTEIAGLQYIAAKVLSYSCGVLNSYIVNSSWTFRRERKRTKKEFFLFICVNVASLCVSLASMYVCRNWLHIYSDFLCNLIATPIAMAVNFFGNKLFVFKYNSQN